MEGVAALVSFTIWVATLATLLILPPGLAVAYALARWEGPGKGVVETVLTLPLVLPPTAVGLVLLELLGRNGPLGRVLDAWGMEVVFTPKAVVLASAVMAFPLLVRSARSGFEEVDPRLVAVARTLGDSRTRAFFRVTLPLAWRGVLVGTLLAFSRALGEFGATVLVAGNIPGRTQTLSLAIFQRTQLGRDAEALRLAGVAALLAFVAVFATEAVTRRRGRRVRA
ncbi:molybdate ABC transporter, permease protein [Myxococcus xanthus DK 1622]|uniref:Molybdenum transport system permease n=1 Tax=Myxococcus xanthus (strain DK1622) TaxID=246197 RepID=Q1CXW2_MYXXD|nr:molybdate ABC transporter, permease protein [Myxococcus xanthus DK 1622]NOJ53370.1 molybdate ABC transporter permease subunit [Myxococcus xanthus]QVW68037.1 molybdate ABC transporter permease subunit [Myxococcus xanthus DZ2]QPM78960.1 molybdate ABC transporter permease subunit [Myxococcus xanthus]QZZ54258.1 Molybdenum transport system permease protein ModB [Myxococcus xanthus]